jgi:hypothetical protein
MLPESGQEWTQQEAISWMEAVAGCLRVAYRLTVAISVKGTPAVA